MHSLENPIGGGGGGGGGAPPGPPGACVSVCVCGKSEESLCMNASH